MLKVLDTIGTEETPATPTLDDLAREGARRMLMAACRSRWPTVCGRLPGGSRREWAAAGGPLRSGRGPEGHVWGSHSLRAPRVNDKRVDATGQRERFTSRILPPYMRR